MRFLCDEMLKRLGRWLRLAGHDVLILPDGTDDRTLIERAAAEDRILLTRDRHMVAQNRVVMAPVLLDCHRLDDCVAALNRQLEVDWLAAPFTRCMQCNTPLVPAAAAQRRAVPAQALAAASRILYCPNCRQVFWDGSHVARMRRRLLQWSRGSGAPTAGQSRRS